MGNEANLFCRSFVNVTIKIVKTMPAVTVVVAVTAVAAVTEHRLRLRLISANTHFLFLLVTDVTGGESIMAKIVPMISAFDLVSEIVLGVSEEGRCKSRSNLPRLNTTMRNSIGL